MLHEKHYIGLGEAKSYACTPCVYHTGCSGRLNGYHVNHPGLTLCSRHQVRQGWGAASFVFDMPFIKPSPHLVALRLHSDACIVLILFNCLVLFKQTGHQHHVGVLSVMGDARTVLSDCAMSLLVSIAGLRLRRWSASSLCLLRPWMSGWQCRRHGCTWSQSSGGTTRTDAICSTQLPDIICSDWHAHMGTCAPGGHTCSQLQEDM
jgi:hypothetical protein